MTKHRFPSNVAASLLLPLNRVSTSSPIAARRDLEKFFQTTSSPNTGTKAQRILQATLTSTSHLDVSPRSLTSSTIKGSAPALAPHFDSKFTKYAAGSLDKGLVGMWNEDGMKNKNENQNKKNKNQNQKNKNKKKKKSRGLNGNG
ncbi:hypothetical protein MY11210_005624 [Beauveria gryllotalpidicola]